MNAYHIFGVLLSVFIILLVETTEVGAKSSFVDSLINSRARNLRVRRNCHHKESLEKRCQKMGDACPKVKDCVDADACPQNTDRAKVPKGESRSFCPDPPGQCCCIHEFQEWCCSP